MKPTTGLPLAAVGGLLLALLAAPPQAHAFDACRDSTTPASGAPESLWGSLRPGDGANVIPADRDTTDFNGSQATDYRFPLFTSVHPVGDWVFTSYYFGFHVWDISGSNRAKPELIVDRDQGRSEFLRNIGYQEDRFLMWDIDAPPGVHSVVAISGKTPFGMNIWDTSNKSDPRQLYQDIAGSGFEVWTTTIDGRHYGFRGALGGPQGLHAYDMSRAVELYQGQTGCVEESSQGDSCGSVHVNWFARGQAAVYVDGVSTSAGRHFVASSAVGRTQGIALWEVTDPRSPTSVLPNAGRLFPSESIFGVALWEQDNRLYLAVRSRNPGIRIHDVTSCLLSGSCSNPPLVWSDDIGAPDLARVTFSKSGSIPMLWAGNGVACAFDVVKEWVWDLRTLTGSGPQEISPTKTVNIEGRDFGYWDSYLRYEQVTPLNGKFLGNVLYRSAYTLFDAHEWVSSDPTITVSGPETGYLGESQGFTANATVCTPDPSGWTWSASGGTGAGNLSTANLTWSTVGDKTVSATNSACPGATVVPATISIDDPDPVIAGVTATPSTAPQCTPITFDVEASGKPTLAYSWEVDTDPVTTATGDPFVWDTSGVLPGTYAGAVTVTNAGCPVGSGCEATDDATVEITTLDPLPSPGFTTLSNDPFPSGTVQFHLEEPGATAWSWDFNGDGSFGDGIPGDWTSDPQTGPNPSHTYTQAEVDANPDCNGNLPCTFQVRVRVRNCLSDPAGVESASLAVEIKEIEPLVPGFHALCEFGVCGAPVGTAITFIDDTEGGPDSYAYAWNNTTAGSCNATFGSPVTAPTTQHTYNQTGTFYPCLRVTRGAETKTFVHVNALPITEAAPPPPPPPSPPPPSPPPPSPPPPSGGIDAQFSVSPAQPGAGEDVTFDASTSIGTNLAFSWDFGDGSATAFGEVVDHTYADPGNYQVTLSLTQQGCFSPDCPSDSLTKSVTVGSGQPRFEAAFETSAECTQEFGVSSCQARTGLEVSFTGTTEGAESHEWDFGDGTTKTGKDVTHVWKEPGPFTLTYTATKGEDSASTTQRFAVTGDPIGVVRNVVVPWISQSDADKALPQSSDLVIHNPGEETMEVKVTFRRQGLPEPDPPTAEFQIAPKTTHHEADIVKDLFNRANSTGFLFVEALEGDAEPVVNSVNRTFQEDGRVFGQVVPGFPVEERAALTEGTQVFHLVGLNSTSERLAYFGISNPSDQSLRYHLRFYDSMGRFIAGTDEPQGVARFGQKQYRSANLLEDFGIESYDDYRIEIEPVEGSPRPYVYGANLRLVSKDPSFLRVGRTDADEVFLVGVLSTPGVNDSLFRSDLVLGNTAAESTLCDLTFTQAGFQKEPTDPLSEAIPAGETLRLEDVVSQWDVGNSVGALRVSCLSSAGVFPVVQGESYDVSRPDEVFGQFMPALTREDAAEPGDPHVLAGLQQDDENRTTLWLFNPTDEVARYSVRYLDLEGNELGGESDIPLGRGKFRQINPGHHPFVVPFESFGPGGFVVVVEVTEGAVLTAAQVVNAANDPAYIVGQ